MNRKKSRELIMKLLFEMSINREDFRSVLANLEDNLEKKIESKETDGAEEVYSENIDKLKNVDMEYVKRVVKGIEENKDSLDKEIEKYLRNWTLNRLPKVDAAILRICTYEFLYEQDIPEKVSINEAIELAKKYSSEKSVLFINGVLGNMIKDKSISKQ
ncbi:transcription antitermination factor NusB [Clostridium ljungdahlii]|uniref:transcription antitermination factor NusB n=1 Tax=Clostridium ljungdahlii TaxID=1538 RepID=UPI003864E9DE